MAPASSAFGNALGGGHDPSRGQVGGIPGAESCAEVDSLLVRLPMAPDRCPRSVQRPLGIQSQSFNSLAMIATVTG